MPNWAEGNLKVRGLEKDIIAFLKGALVGVPDTGASLRAIISGQEIETPGIEIEEDTFNLKMSSPNGLHIQGTRRAFIEGTIDYWFNEIEDEEEPQKIVFVIDNFKQAWAVHASDYKYLSGKYNLDIQINAFERGMEFNQLVEIHQGEIVKDEEILFDDYEWECIMPNLGG